MDEGLALSGQMELRLEAFQYTNLTDLKVDADATVTAKYQFSDTNYYVFTVSDYSSSGNPQFSWYEVTIGDFNIYTRSYEDCGPAQGLPELLAMDDGEGILANYWRDAAMALVGIHEVAAEIIQECVNDAVLEASNAASERLTERFQQPTSAPFYDVDEYFSAFKAACHQRAQYCDGIEMDWGNDLGKLPGVMFGLSVGAPGQIIYQADPERSKQLFLNGFWTAEYCLEEDLLEQFPDDAWARLGARNAARDLLAIQRTGYELMAAQRSTTLQEIDQERRDRKLDAMAAGQPFDVAWWSEYASSWLEGDLVDLFERVKEYLVSIKPKPSRNVKRGPKPGVRAAPAPET